MLNEPSGFIRTMSYLSEISRTVRHLKTFVRRNRTKNLNNLKMYEQQIGVYLQDLEFPKLNYLLL